MTQVDLYDDGIVLNLNWSRLKELLHVLEWFAELYIHLVPMPMTGFDFDRSFSTWTLMDCVKHMEPSQALSLQFLLNLNLFQNLSQVGKQRMLFWNTFFLLYKPKPWFHSKWLLILNYNNDLKSINGLKKIIII